MKVAVAGFGYWGPNLVRNFLIAEGISEVGLFDPDPERAGQARRHFPQARRFDSFGDVLASDYDAVALAVPIARHHELGMRVLRAGKHLFVEKPLALTVAECEELVETAQRLSRVVLVDHTFVYAGAVRKIKELVASGVLGEVYYFDSVRVNLGMLQHDVSVLWDLASHDVAIMDFVLGARPSAVMAMGGSHYGRVEDIAYLHVTLGAALTGHVHVNWLSPVKIRRVLIGGSRKSILFDDMEPSEKVKVYEAGVEVKTREGVYKTLVEYRTGDMHAPKLDLSEPLSIAVRDFERAVRTGDTPASDGWFGLRVVRVLEAAEHSIQQRGAQVAL